MRSRFSHTQIHQILKEADMGWKSKNCAVSKVSAGTHFITGRTNMEV
jgi:hypothetical protein